MVATAVVRGFTVVDLTPQCEVRLQARYEYELLERIEGAADLLGRCAAAIWRDPEGFDLCLTPSADRLKLRWRASSATSGIAVLMDQDQTYSLSLLASGLDNEADRLTLAAFQTHVVRQLLTTPFEPAFDLLELWQRPLLATVGLFMPHDPQERTVFAIADRCFGAAYFRKVGLA